MLQKREINYARSTVIVCEGIEDLRLHSFMYEISHSSIQIECDDTPVRTVAGEEGETKKQTRDEKRYRVLKSMKRSNDK